MFAGLLVLLLILLLPGWLLTSLLFQQVRQRLSVWETSFFTLVFGIGVVSWIGLLLAEFGVYSVTRVVFGTATVSAVLVALAQRMRVSLRPNWRAPSAAELSIGLVLISVVGFFYAFPADSVRGGRDWGIYTATAHLLNHTGSLLQTEPEIGAIQPENLEAFSVPRGFYLVGKTTTMPQFFHLYPVTLAIFEASFPGSLFYVTPFLGMLCLLGIAAFGRRLGFRLAPLAVLLLSLNIGYSWFFRSSYAEGLTQAYLFAGLLAWVIALEERAATIFATAGALLGFTLLTKIDAIATIGPIGLAFVYTWLSGRVTFREILAALGGLAGVTTHALVHALTLALPYTAATISIVATRTSQGISRTGLILPGMVTMVVLVVLGLVVYTLGTKYGRGIAGWIEGQKWIATALGLFLIVIAGYGLYVRPALFPTPPGSTHLGAYDVEAFQHFGWYTTHLGIWLGILGLLVYLRRFDARALPFVTAAVFVALASFYRPNIYPDHFWQTRRFVLIIFPAFALFATYFLETIWQRFKAARLPVFFVAVLLVVMTAQPSLPFLFHRDFLGLSEQLEDLAEKTGEADYVLLAPELQAFTVPLRYIYNRPALEIGPQAKPEQLGDQITTWLQQGKIVLLLEPAEFLGTRIDNVSYEPIGQHTIEVPHAEVTYERPPRKVLTMRQTIFLYRIVPRNWKPDRFDWVIGALEDINSPIRGVYAREGNPKTPFRWTSGQLDIDLTGLPTGRKYLLSLDMCGHSATAGRKAQVQLTGSTLSEFTVEEGCRSYHFIIPASQVQTGENLLTVSLPTFVPAQISSQSSDRRELGVQLRRITMRPVNRSEITVEDLLAEGTSQGFYTLERNVHGPFVWMMGTAEFSLEVQPSSDSLVLELASGRPEGVPQPQVRVFIDGELAAQVVPRISGYSDYEIPLPAGRSRVHIGIETDTWSPARTGHGSDTRELGLALRAVRFSEKP
ncbi:MAG: hypothetical protein ACOY93_08980 [Bacillota bacterium]